MVFIITTNMASMDTETLSFEYRQQEALEQAVEIVNRALKRRAYVHGDDTTGYFNCGKMKHIFEIDDNNKYINEQTLDKIVYDIKTFLNDVRIYLKVDGQCGAIAYDPKCDEYALLTRYDDKKNKFRGMTELPIGYFKLSSGNIDKYSKAYKKQSHHYYLKVMPRPLYDDKSKMAKVIRELYGILDKMSVAERKGRLRNLGFNSCEYVGDKFQKTPTIIGNDIALHREQLLSSKFYPGDKISYVEHYNILKDMFDNAENKTVYDVLKEYFGSHGNTIEGFIIYHKKQYDSIFYKVRQNVFHKIGYDQYHKKWCKAIKKNDVDGFLNNSIPPMLLSYKRQYYDMESVD